MDDPVFRLKDNAAALQGQGRLQEAAEGPARRKPLSRSNGGAEDSDRLRSACQEMESLFVYHMMREMRKSVPKNDLLDGGQAEETYRSLLDMEWAKKMSVSQGVGLGDLLYAQLSRNINHPEADAGAGEAKVSGDSADRTTKES